MHIIAQTPRFVIRDFKPEEEDTYMKLFDDQRVTLHLPDRSREEHLAIFRKAFVDYTANKALGRWGMFNHNDGDFIGLCLLRNFNTYDDGKIEVGYVMHHKYWGNGIASEMATILVGYALTHSDAKEIVAVTTLGNAGSQRVLEKAGLTRMPNIMRDAKELAYFCMKVKRNKKGE